MSEKFSQGTKSNQQTKQGNNFEEPIVQKKIYCSERVPLACKEKNDVRELSDIIHVYYAFQMYYQWFLGI